MKNRSYSALEPLPWSYLLLVGCPILYDNYDVDGDGDGDGDGNGDGD